jgi:hypothetical protein
MTPRFRAECHGVSNTDGAKASSLKRRRPGRKAYQKQRGANSPPEHHSTTRVEYPVFFHF